jgi:hypothetical protein
MAMRVQLVTPEPSPEASHRLLRQLEEFPRVAVLQVVPPHPGGLSTLSCPAQLAGVLQANTQSNRNAQG